MNGMDGRQTIPYGRRQLQYQKPNQTVSLGNRPYYPINDQLQYLESRIVTQNNSSLVSVMHTKPNRFSAYQQIGQTDSQNKQVLPEQSKHGVLHNIPQGNQQVKARNTNSNRINVVSSQNNSGLSYQNSQSSLTKRPGSVSRGGIKVMSRNSSMEKKSENSVEKSITSNDLKNASPNQQSSNLAMCGMNCKSRSPFTQNQNANQMVIVPNLGSLQTLQSHMTEQQLLSQRQKLRLKQNSSTARFNSKNAYGNISERVHIQPSFGTFGQNQSQLIQKQNLAVNSQKMYKQVREMMEKEIGVARKIYEKKYLDEIECLNVFYKSQIQTLQKVLAQNQTVVEQQASKIQKLADKVAKKDIKLERYSERLESLRKFIDSSNRFAAERVQQVEKKFQLLLEEFHSFRLSPQDSSRLQNRVYYLQGIFTTLMVQTIVKYRGIQCSIKEQVRQMMKKYEYFEEKVYEMDLMKHLGKENQIQNYRLIQNIEGLKENLVILESMANMKAEMRELSVLRSSGQEMDSIEVGGINVRIDQLKKVINGLQFKVSSWQGQSEEQISKIYKLQSAKRQLQTKVKNLESEIEDTRKDLAEVRTQRDDQAKKKAETETKFEAVSPQKKEEVFEFEITTEKKEQENPCGCSQQCSEQAQIEIAQLSRELERLNETIDQYECKIQQLHCAINKLQQENSALHQENSALLITMNQKSALSQKQSSIRENLKPKEQDEYQSIIQKLNNLLEARQYQLDSYRASSQEAVKEKQQLTAALEMTEKIFDQQISKFKQTIQLLQLQNDQLLNQLNDLKDSATQSLAESVSSNKSNLSKQRISLAKSPKKEVCQIVTMGWFKKTLQQQHNTCSSNNNSQTSCTQNFLSPIQQYKSNAGDYEDKVKQCSNSNFSASSLGKNDQFFYPQSQNRNQSSRQSFDQTSIMKTEQTLALKDRKSQIQLYQQSKKQKFQKQKIQTQNTILKQSNSLPGYTIDSYSNLNNVQRLRNALQQMGRDFPVECTTDRQGQVILSKTGHYIVDQNYSGFKLSQRQIDFAEKVGIVRMAKQDEELGLRQEQAYIF